MVVPEMFVMVVYTGTLSVTTGGGTPLPCTTMPTDRPDASDTEIVLGSEVVLPVFVSRVLVIVLPARSTRLTVMFWLVPSLRNSPAVAVPTFWLAVWMNLLTKESWNGLPGSRLMTWLIG